MWQRKQTATAREGRWPGKARVRVPSTRSRALPGTRDAWVPTPGWYSGVSRQKSLGFFAPTSVLSGRWRHCSKHSLLCLLPILALRQLANSLQPVLPAFGQAVAMFGQDQSQGAVEEHQARNASLRVEAVLQVIDRRVRHHERPANLQEGRRFHNLHMAPKVAGIVAEVAVPAS